MHLSLKKVLSNLVSDTIFATYFKLIRSCIAYIWIATFNSSIILANRKNKDTNIDLQSLRMLAIQMKQKVHSTIDNKTLETECKAKRYGLRNVELCSPEFLDFLDSCFSEENAQSVSKVMSSNTS